MRRACFRHWTSPVMASLKFKLETIDSDKNFDILSDYLQPDSSMTLQSAAQSIDSNLPGGNPQSDHIYLFSEICIEIAEQVPYHLPSQLNLAELLEYLGSSQKLGRAYPLSDM